MVTGYESKPIGKSGWHAFRVTTRTKLAPGVLVLSKPNCPECKRPSSAGCSIYRLRQIAPPVGVNTFFAPVLGCPSLRFRDRSTLFTEDVLQALKTGGIKGPYCDRLWTDEEFRRKDQAEKHGKSWKPAGMTVYLKGR
jgi:hypothetical protein